MIVVTEKGFVRLTGCYDVRCERNPSNGPWKVWVVWSWNDGCAALLETESESEALRITDALAEVAAGDTGDKERRIDVRELVEWRSAK
jgi:hypothetical protein